MDHPIGIALSGGGDSLALLSLVTDWARVARRRVVAITVDHGLNPESERWNQLCEAAARRSGAAWILCRWDGSKPSAGLPAAARRARHALIADAARSAGARVVLMGHSADDIAEGDWMRARGSTLGRLREWSPSPVWPEGRGLMLLRPLLVERRGGLRQHLRDRGVDWIEDPANHLYGRGQARRALALSCEDTPPVAPDQLGADHRTDRDAPIPLALGEGVEGRGELAFSLLCVAGHDRLPKGSRLANLAQRIALGQAFTATLAGARIQATDDRLLILREAGEFRRRPPRPVMLAPDEPVVWDGRYEITALQSGWTVMPAIGHLAAMNEADRAIATRVPAAARGALPILIRDDDPRPVLAWRAARVLALAPRRLKLSLGETTQERDLADAVHGETPPADLF